MYRDSAYGVTFQHPDSLGVSSHVRLLSDNSTALDINMTSSKTSVAGQPAKAKISLSDFGAYPGAPFEESLRKILDDPNRLLVVVPCELGPTATPCLQVKDQHAWQKWAGTGFINTLVYFHGPTHIYGTENGQVGSFDPYGEGVKEILQTIMFDR